MPTEFGLLSKLYGLCDLTSNDLSGTVPTEFGLLSKLRRLCATLALDRSSTHCRPAV